MDEETKLEPNATGGDAVNHPPHYNVGYIEVIDAIEAWKLDFCLGNAVKYIARADHKGNAIEDLKKAKWYIDRKIEWLESEMYKKATNR